MARITVQITTPSNNRITVSPGVSALSSVQLYLNELVDVDTSGGQDGYVLTQQADGSFAMNAIVTRLDGLSDTNIVSPGAGDALVYDDQSSKWVPGGVKSVNGQEGDVVITIPSPPPTPGVSGLADTNITNLQDDQIIRYDSNSGNWLNEDLEALPAGGTAGQALVKVDGTDYNVQWADIAVDVQYHDRYQSQSATLRSGATATTEIYYSAIADGDGYAESASSDTPATGYDIRRKLYYSEAGFADPDTGTWTQFTAIADNTTFANAKAALLAYLKERTGGTVPISLKMTWEEVAQAPAFTGLLNESYGSGAEAAYSTRRLNGNYTGDCMTIRRASDGTTQSIGFVGEEIDESAIETFCTGTTCTVVTWFDQSGNGNHATQTTAANQPTIYTGGQLVKEGGRLALEFDGSNDHLNGALSITDDFTSLAIAKTTDISNNAKLFADETNAKGFLYVASSEFNWYDGSTVSKIADADTTQNLFYVSANATNSVVAIDGSDQSVTTINNSGFGSLRIGGRVGASQYWTGNAQELIFYPSDKRTDRTNIEGNISAYFQSAKLLDESFGSGAEAAYSTRQLRRDQTECMVIRRASDSTTTTIGFDSNGNIDEAAINTFCTGTTCTVVTWKDQSGNGNDATAPSTGAEPTIYTGGALVKDNGKPSLRFDGSQVLESQSVPSMNNVPLSIYNTVIADTTNNGSFVTTGFANNQITDTIWAHIIAGGGHYAELKTNPGYSIKSVNTGVAPTDFALISINADNNLDVWQNGISIGSNSLTGFTSGAVTKTILIGDSHSNSRKLTGNVSESIIYGSSKSTVDRTNIESNIGNYFGQNTPLLDTYTGAAAAYSLRLLDSTYTGSAVEVYNGTSYADIGFNVFGELDTVALAAHCGSNDGFVSKWYDQSSNGNTAAQTVTGSMPKIYDGTTGGVLLRNGKPYVNAYNKSLLTSLSNVSQPYTISAVFASQNAYARHMGNNAFLYQDSGSVLFLGNEISNGGTFATGDQLNVFGVGNGSSSFGKVANATNQPSGVTFTSSTNFDLSVFFARYATSSTTNRSFAQEFIIWGSDQSSNRTDIEDNINTFYSIY